jgi:hypothetical protein
MLQASPSLAIRLLTVSAGGSWDDAWATAIGDHVYATSFHDGYLNEPKVFTEESVTECAMHPKTGFLGTLLCTMDASITCTYRSYDAF